VWYLGACNVTSELSLGPLHGGITLRSWGISIWCLKFRSQAHHKEQLVVIKLCNAVGFAFLSGGWEDHSHTSTYLRLPGLNYPIKLTHISITPRIFGLEPCCNNSLMARVVTLLPMYCKILIYILFIITYRMLSITTHLGWLFKGHVSTSIMSSSEVYIFILQTKY
jgi:hypothetical protein